MKTRRTLEVDSRHFAAPPTKMKVVEILESKAETLQVKDLVGLLGLSKSKLYAVIARGELPSLRIDGSIRVDPNHVIAWWKQRQSGLAASAAMSGTGNP